MKYCILICSLIIHTVLYSQSSENKLDSTFIKKYNDSFIFKVGLQNAGETFTVNNNDANYTLKPNTDIKTKIWFNYRFIAFSIGFTPKFIPGDNDDALKGKSTIGSINMSLIFPHWIQNLAYSKTKGYYISNTADFIDDWDKNKDRYIQFPNLQHESYSGYTAYKFNENYSVKALSNQTEHQIKSCGSLIAFVLYEYYTIDNKETISESNSTQKSKNFETTAQLGYFYTKVWNKHFYISGGTAAGFGFINSQLLTRSINEDIHSHSLVPQARLEAQCALGYNSNRFFGGAQAIASWQKYKQEKSTVSTDNKALNVQFFVGYKFGMLKPVNKLFDKYNL